MQAAMGGNKAESVDFSISAPYTRRFPFAWPVWAAMANLHHSYEFRR